MSLGSVLIKPQPVATPLPPQVDPSEVIAGFLEAFTRNPEGAAAAAEVFARVAPETLANFVHGMEERVRLSDGKIRALFRPFGAGIDAFTAGLDKGEFVDVLKGGLELVAAVLQQLTKARVQAFVREFADIVTKDLGISKQTLRDLVTTLATQIITELKRDVIAGQVTRTSIARYEFGAALDGLKSLFDEEEIEVPALDLQVILDAIDLLWDQGRIDRIIAWVLELIGHADDVLQPLAVAIQARFTLKLEVQGSPAPVGAAVADGATVALDAPAPPAAPTSGQQPIAWYASWVAAKTLRYPTDDSVFPSRFRNPELIGFSYKNLSKETMESMAFHTAWLVPAVEALLLHVPSMEQGDVLSNLHITILDVLDFGLILGDKSPVPVWWHWTAKPLMTMFLWGFESGWDRVGASNDPYVWTNAAGDMGEVLLYWRWSRLMRELLLSFFTLLNHDPDATLEIRHADTGELVVRNVERYEGICYIFWELGSMLVPLIMSRTNRSNYGFVGGGPTATFWGIAFGGFAVSAAFGYLSILVARLIAGEFFDSALRYGLLLGRDRLYGPYRFQADFSSFSEGADSIGGWLGTPLAFVFMLGASIGDGPIYTYLFTDGNTDDGELCTDINGKEVFAFRGYPDASISPYKLPWAGQQQCVQGNLGVWSHYPQSQQTYAYDYSHNVGTEILCSRTGIVVRISDTNPDNNPNNWNFVEVLHLTLNPASGGLAAVAPPAGITNFADGTAIPAGTLFPPYWLPGTSTPLQGLPNPVPLHPSAAILPGATPTAPGSLAGAPAYYTGLNGFNAGTTFSFLVPGIDRAIPGIAAGATFSDGTATPIPDGVVPPGTSVPPAPGTTVFAAGTDFVYDANNVLQPLQVTIAVYGHCIFGFMQISTAPTSPTVPNITQTPRPSGLVDVYRSRTNNQVTGLFVPQGRVIALSGDTGISAYNHLHTHVIGRSSALGNTWTIPFNYVDVVPGIVHGLREGLRSRGVPRSFTFYDSGNTRIAPT